MNSLVCGNLNFHSNPQFPLSNSLLHFHSFPLKNRTLPHFPSKRWISISPSPNFSSSASFNTSSAAATTSTGYGGWESDIGGSDHSGESTQLRNFLVSLGIDDRKYVFVFLLGIICALAVARVRVSTIVVFPASVIVFAVGFSFGFVRRGSVSEIIVSPPSKRSGKDDNFKVCLKKLRNLMESFDGFDTKLNNLKNRIKSAVYNDEISVVDLESYVKVIDSMRESASLGKVVVEGCIENIGVLGNLGESNGELVENQKSSRRRKEVGNIGFDLSQFLAGLFGENFVGLKPNRLKGSIERDAKEMKTNNKTEGNHSPAGEEFLDFVTDDNKPVKNHPKVDKLGDAARNIRTFPENGKMDLVEMDRRAERLHENEEYSYQNHRFRTMNDHRFSLNTGHRNATETWASYDSLHDSVNFSVSVKRTESEASFHQEQILRNSREAYLPSRSRENNETFRSNVREAMEYPEDLSNSQFTHKGEKGYSSSSTLSDDVQFDKYLAETNGLLKQARESLRSGCDEDRAEVKLYKSAELLSKAIAMKPMSLLAIGQLGNTYLLHGEVKLKVSRELRTLLTGSEPLSFEKWGNVLKGLGDQVSSKDKIASLLVNVCEECEELLIEAGKRYRMALSIDASDTRALYNWGLALSFRAQLIADIGPVSILLDKIGFQICKYCF